jgi:hypothetical protein
MHVVHAIDYMVTEPDREDGDEVASIAQEEFRLPIMRVVSSFLAP